MKRLGFCAALAALAVVLPASSQTTAPPPGAFATPSDYILLTVIMRHDQTKNLGEINKIQDEQDFWAKFPPEGIQIESWYIAMGLGYVVTLRVPPARLREVNRSVEQGAWKAFRTEFYTSYDAKEIARTLREQALKK
jgi:hypothetical protein